MPSYPTTREESQKWLGRRPAREAEAGKPEGAPIRPESSIAEDTFNELKARVHEQLLRELDLPRLQAKHGPDLRRAIEEATALILLEERVPLSRSDQLRFIREVVDEVVGLGPLEALLNDASVTEIMVNGPRQVFVEREGLVSLSGVSFRDNAHIMRIIERIVGPIGRHIDESSPMVDARLTDGSRVNAIIPPLAVRGPSLTIRKFFKIPLTIDRLIELGSLTADVSTFLRACIEGRVNAVIAGGTGSGKTTMLSLLAGFIPPRERIVTIEDPCELQLSQPNVVQLETRPPNIEGRGEIGQRQLVKNALRMRPDRIIVGEVRGGEAFDMLQAMNTGHDGSLTTVHANTPRDALSRIENMVLMAGLELPMRVIREQVASAVQLVVHVSRLPDGSRRLVEVTEVLGLEGETIAAQDLFVFRRQGLDANGRIRGALRPTGVRPRLLRRLRERGITLPDELFAKPASLEGDEPDSLAEQEVR